MTVEINLNDDEYKTISEYVAENKISLSEFFLNLAREHFEYFNSDTIAAMHEAKLISEGKIPAKSYDSVEELMEDLMSDAED